MRLDTHKRGRWLALLLAAVMLVTEGFPVTALANGPEDLPPPRNEMVSVVEEEMEDTSVTVFESGNQPVLAENEELTPETNEESLPEGREETSETPAAAEGDTALNEEGAAAVPFMVVSDFVLPTEQADAAYQTADGGWVTGMMTEAVNNVVDGGIIRLLRDVVVNNNDNDALLIDNKEVTIQGEGHSLCLERGSFALRGTGKLNLGQAGYGESLTVLSRDDANCIIYMTDSAKMEMYDGVTLGPSQAGGQPAGVYMDKNTSFIMHGGQIRDCENWASVSGGVLITGNASFEMKDGLIENCHGYSGGAFLINPLGSMEGGSVGSARFRMSGGEIRGCSSKVRGGGALLAYTGQAVDIEITGGKITGCSAIGNTNGGGIYLYISSLNAHVSISGVEISGCKASSGGAAYLAMENLNIGDNVVITGNTAERMGGGLWMFSRSGTRFGAIKVEGNKAATGGGIVMYGGKNDLTRAVVCNNTASSSGDDLYAVRSSIGNTEIVLPTGFGGNKLNGCGHLIDGWYADHDTKRWSCPGTDGSWNAGPITESIATGEAGATLGLKAAHGPIKAEPVVITPADIITYSGGVGYLGLVDRSGTAAGKENGVPQPGYYITLPESLTKLLGNEGKAVNLSGMLTFHHDDHAGTTRHWDLELYGTASNSIGSKSEYVYKMVPGGDQQALIRMVMVHEDTHEAIMNDSGTPGTYQGDRYYQIYRMMIYREALEAGYITARLTIGDNTYTYPVEADDGLLTVRNFTDRTTFKLAENPDAVASTGITALTGDGTTYFINHSNVELADASNVQLMVDTVREEEKVIDYLKNHLKDNGTDRWNYQARYLDLVDTANGNAYVTMGKGQEKVIYWAAPEGTSKDSLVEVYRFDTLNRSLNYPMEVMLEQKLPSKVEAETVELQGRTYFKFSTSDFATFVLRYQEPEPKVQEYQLAVKFGSGSGSYTADTEVQITAEEAPEGKEFDRWSTDKGGTFGNEKESSTTFHMPANDVTVTALYKDKTVPAQPDKPARRPDRPYRPYHGKNTTDEPAKETKTNQEAGTAKSVPEKEVPYTGGAEETACWLALMLTSLTGTTVLGSFFAEKKRTARFCDNTEDL